MPLGIALCAPALSAAILATDPVTGSPPSVVPRGNQSLDPRRRKPVYSVGAAARFGVLIGNGQDIVQPYGYGFAAQIRAHFLNLGVVRFGLGFHAGHTRFPELRTLEGVDEVTGEFVKKDRWARISHTDLSLGPSFGVPLGPVILAGSVTPGLGIDQLFEPVTPFASQQDTEITSYDFLLRGGVALGVPIRKDHGISVGVAIHKYWSNAEYTVPAGKNAGEKFSPFDLMLETFVSYTAWF